MATESGLLHRVEFLGVVRGIEKWRLYRRAWALCTPSHSEVIGMVNLEAAACGTPVIASVKSGIIPEWGEEGGLLIQPHVDSILDGLRRAAAWSPAERDERGAAMRRVVERHYSWDVIKPRWLELYRSLA